MDKAKDLAENVGSSILNKADEVSDMGKNQVDDMSSLFDTPSDMVKDAAEKVNDPANSVDSFIEKAHDLADRLEKKIKVEEPEAKEPPIGYDNLKNSSLDSHDDFFSKASRYADGDYHNTGAKDEGKEGEMTIMDKPEETDSEAPFSGTIAGYEDLDGDGDPIIDDAIIDEEESGEEEKE